MTVEQKRALLRLYCLGRDCSDCRLENGPISCFKEPNDVEKNFNTIYETCGTLRDVVKELEVEEVEQTAIPLNETISTDENEVTIRAGENSNVDCVMVYFNKNKESEDM